MADGGSEARAVERERWRTLRLIEGWLEGPMMVLGLVWLALLVVELTSGLSRFLRDIGTLIWIAFLFDFALRFILAPNKLAFLRRNVLTVVSLALPAFRTLRVLRLAGAARGLRLVRVLGTLNRGLASVRRATRRRGLGYVLLASVLVVVGGSAGLFALERGLAAAGGGFDSYATSLWWTARIVMTVGPEFWPQTPEGRLLALVLALYGYATFGYVTAALASLFVDRDAASVKGEVVGRRRIEALHAEIRALREDLRRR
ncbi:ion transporter [Arenibaculum sp.]|jgi:voltage-gated potassium channel|uniref:ion transporter n=1 Tax=Arenibaculum sp. TaxID=2865862 RepID=UPI002E151536|nr:ion transporter [Arenibaculum sp.]